MIKQKSWLWWFTLFANPSVTTTIYPNIYLCKSFSSFSKETQQRILQHERVHLQQQKQYGLVSFLFLYIFVLPLFYNPWRYQWEWEAYTRAGTSKDKTRKYLSSWHYGFLLSTKQ